MERNKLIYLLSTLVFLILLLIFFFSGFYEMVLGGINWLFIPVIFIHSLIFLLIIFKSDFSKTGNYVSSIFNWLALIFLLSSYFIVSSQQSVDSPFASGFLLIFLIWPILSIFTLISWISSIIFYFKNNK